LKYILYLPDIDQNLLIVGQLINKGFKVIFEDKWYLIKDNRSSNVLKVENESKRFGSKPYRGGADCFQHKYKQ
jgi:hypothetical protein